MKHQLILLCLLFLAVLGFSQNIKVSGLKLKYKKGENLNFTISNQSDSVLYLSSFALEKLNKLDGEWYEQVYDILNRNCGELLGKEGFSLDVDSEKKICWNPQKINPLCFNYKNNFGKYRLVFKYSTAINVKENYYIKEFIILNTKAPY